MEEKQSEITLEEIGNFMEGKDPEKRIVNLLYNYQNPYITVVYRNEKDQKCQRKDNFYPFVWATHHACVSLCHGDREELKRLMAIYKIGVKKLSNVNYKGEIVHEFDNGYMYMFYARNPMSYSRFLNFFKKCDYPVKRKLKDKNGNEILIPKEDKDQFLSVSPQEQFMISTGKRFFKGYNDYNEVLRMIFDLETEGLDPHKHRIKLNGIRMNRPVTVNGKTYESFERIFDIKGDTKEEKDKSELKIIDTMLRIIYTFKPDIITAHNGENFDWNFFIVRCQMLGTTMEEMSAPYFDGEVIKKENYESSLKLGGEVESFYRTIVPGIIVTDSLHAVRRAQATDSNFKKATLKYATKYLHLKKDNRVYTPGDKIDQILIDEINDYAFNDTDGDWYIYDPSSKNGRDADFKKGKDGDNPFKMYTRNYLADGYEIVSGRYIIERYLKDDLWECDKVELKLNTANFFICKILPVPFSKCCTMGTAGQWKTLLMAWSFEKGLAIPKTEKTKLTVGGLSRLLSIGGSVAFVDENGQVQKEGTEIIDKNGSKYKIPKYEIVKFDYNSLYPSIMLTWGIEDWQDLSGVLLKMLNYVLTSREKYKGYKKNADKIISKYDKKIVEGNQLTKEEHEEYAKAQADFSLNDKIQNSFKVLGNSMFGSISSTNSSVFPWKSDKNGHQITCTGRQCLRLMISHFHDIKGPNGETEEFRYKPIVGDSVTGDTPLFIKYKDTGLIDIKPISELISEENIETDVLGREYDYSNKPYFVLCRSGWHEVNYVYRHSTSKNIYRVKSENCFVDVTEDHSLYNDKQEKINPKEITDDTKLEFYTNAIDYNELTTNFPDSIVKEMAKQLADGTIDRVPYPILNGNKKTKLVFYKEFVMHQQENKDYSKTCLAGIMFIAK